ncbi:SDR family NAD(P)-dependent oxidoreductase, partial [Bacillus inaquosorum]
KSNIGHAESAAGISGLSKVALQLHYQTLVPSLHSEELNPYVDFEKSPFYVQHEAETWKQPVIKENGKDLPYPRRAGISSFGATGSNAHIIVEEYIPQTAEQDVTLPSDSEMPAVIPLSARNQVRLHVYAKRLLDFLHDGIQIRDLAYTLQVGREPMEERVAFVADGIQELTGQLKAFIEGHETVQHCWMGRVSRGSDLSLSAETVHKSLEQRNFDLIAEQWVNGASIDWKLLYDGKKPKRISLPTYPFEKVRYWVPKAEAATDRSKREGHVLHPLLHQNVSDMSGVRFRSAFTGHEFFLKDHVIKGERVLPGAALLEMVRAAVEKAAANQFPTGFRLRNIVWVRPFAVTEQQADIHIRLYPEDNGEIAFEICQEPESAEKEPVVYGQGSAVLCEADESPVINIEELKANDKERILSPSDCYDAYADMGIHYGDSHRAIDSIYAGKNGVLAKLTMPSVISDTQDRYVLHPSMIDSAFQASIGLRLGGDASLTDRKAMLPFALQDVQIFKGCEASMWARITYSEGSAAGDRMQKLDIDLCNEEGQVCVRMKGYSARVLETEAENPSETIDTLLFEHVWEENARAEKQELIGYETHKIIVCDFGEQMESIRNHLDCTVLQHHTEAIDERFEGYAVQLFEEIKQLLHSKAGGHTLIQVAVPALNEPQLLSGLTGLLKTAELENPKLTGQLIELDTGVSASDIFEILEENRRCPRDTHIRYWQGKRFVSKWKETSGEHLSADIPWKDNGVYLITGGAGGLGFIFANEIANETNDAVVILTGRSPLDERKQAMLQELQKLNVRAVYRKADLTEKRAVDALMEEIQNAYGGLDGIIHSAGMIKDNFIIKKKKEEIQTVLAPKVTGLIHLDEATKDIPLDFFILFSSGAGAVGSAGQADYAMANAFMNAFSEYRNGQAALRKRYGKTLSVCWPLWKDGGMRIDAETARMLTKETGMVAMETGHGIQALYHGWASGKPQLLVASGVANRIRAFLYETGHGQGQSQNMKNTNDNQDTEKADIVFGADEETLREKAENYVKQVLSSVIKLPASQIDAEAPLENYGIDSIMIMHVTGQLEKVFGSLSKTLFFEYQDIRSLTRYFTDSHREKLLDILGIEKDKPSAAENTNTDSEPEKREISVAPRKSGFFPLQEKGQQQSREKGTEEIAIIGISGRYPQADNIYELWENLRDGRDCITEIPEDRWDHSHYYDEDKDKPGKTYSKWGGFMKD